MPTYSHVEIAVGSFVLLCIGAIAYLSVSLGDVSWFDAARMELLARFATVGDLKSGAAVKMAGVRVGEVRGIRLENYAAEVVLAVEPTLALPKDTIASIRTSGLLGESYVSLSPGADEANLASGDRIAQTEPPLDLVELVSKYAFGEANETGEDAPAPEQGDDGGPGSPFEE